MRSNRCYHFSLFTKGHSYWHLAYLLKQRRTHSNLKKRPQWPKQNSEQITTTQKNPKKVHNGLLQQTTIKKKKSKTTHNWLSKTIIKIKTKNESQQPKTFNNNPKQPSAVDYSCKWKISQQNKAFDLAFLLIDLIMVLNSTFSVSQVTAFSWSIEIMTGHDFKQKKSLFWQNRV